MNEFLSQIKNQFNSSKEISFLLINTFEIEIIVLMFMGTTLQFFKGLQFISHQNVQNLTSINISILVAHLIVFSVILWEIYDVRNRKNKRENIKKFIAKFIKCYKNILMIPAFYISFRSIKDGQNLGLIIIGVINILIGTFFCYIKQTCCVSYRFRVRNYFRKFGTTIIDLFLIILIIAVNCFEGSHYGAIVMIFKNIFRLSRVYYCFEEPIVQKIQIFYNLYQLMICTMIITAQFLEYNFQQNLACVGAVLVFGGIIIGHATQIFSFSIYNRMISTSSLLLMQQQIDIVQQNQQGMIKKHFNQIRVMSMIYLQKQKYEQKQQNQFNKWWQFFNRKVLIHKVNCVNPKCKCLVKKLPDSDIQIFMKQLINDIRRLSVTFSKQMKLKIMTIYMYIQILRKPLKAYYELMRLKSQKKTDSFDIELADLSTETRQCFDQLFLKNKVKNQKLQLFKVIQFQQYVQQCQIDMKKIITQTMQFYSNFNYNTIKISQIKQESNNLQLLKKSFQNKLLKILNDYSSNLKLTILIHLFYNYIQVYQNKQTQLKKISHQQLFKKRIFDKKEINVFSPQFGSIFIDLVQQRGKIKNLTKNMCTIYGYPQQDMVNFNVNLFMPRLFGKHHAKFLHNFIEKGKFRLLKESFRSIFGKNKKKFLFPMKISLKAEYLLDNFFGSSSLLRPIETFSQFIIVDKYGKIEQMTEGIYKRIFLGAFSDENQKVSRLHINKLIPSYNVFYQSGQERGASYDKIIEGAFIYCDDGNYLIEKFKFIKDFSKVNKQLSSNNSNNNNNYSISFTDVTNSTLIYSKQEQEINLNDAMKYFLMDIEMFLLRAVKVAYKVTPVVTAQFEAQLLQIVSVKPFVNQQLLYQTILDQLSNLLQLFNFQLDDRQLIKTHLDKLQNLLQSKYFQYVQSHSVTTQPQYSHSMYNLIGQDAPRQVKKTTKLTFQDVQSIQFQDNRLYDQQNQLAQKASINNSSLDTLEGDSKRQVLVNAFSNGDKKIINSKFSKIAYLAIFTLLALLVTLLIKSVMYLKLLGQEWVSINHVSEMKNILQYRKSLIQIQQYQQLVNKQEPSQFIKTQIQSLNDKFKLKIENIYESVVKEEKFNQLYTQEFMLSNSVNKQYQVSSFILLVREILWRFSYSIEQSTQYLQFYYQSITNEFSLLQQNQSQFLLQTEQQTIFTLLIINILYLVLIILVGLGLLPVFLYFKNQQKTMIQLLQYISFTQLKKSLRKLNLIQAQLSKLDRIDNFDHMKNQIKSNLLLLNKDNNNQQSPNINKSPRIIASTANGYKRSLTKSICVGVLIVIFLSNLPILTMLQLQYVSMEFRQSIKLNQIIYKFQAKPAILINLYLMNFNKLLKGDKTINISKELQKQISQQYFLPQILLSQPRNKKLTISQKLFPMIQQSLCNYLEQPCIIDKQLTFNYLVYLFKNKFQFLSQQKNTLFMLGQNNSGKLMINEWMVENNIGQILQNVNQVIKVSDQVNQEVYQQYQNKFHINSYSLISIGVVLIVLNAIVLLIVQHFTFDHFNSVLKQTQNVFRHFDLDTLSENTYLTSYFNAKIKDSK